MKQYGSSFPSSFLINRNALTPASFHVRSEREYLPAVVSWEYPREFLVSRVFRNGAIRWCSENWIMVSTALIGKEICLEELANGIWRACFRCKLLGYLDEHILRIKDIKAGTREQKG
jgi:hypothetical protein